ncbi:MAG: CRISPR-associated protein Cas4 [Salinibacter sp.]|uniref:CRISPR-associated protein Cas4 n=1 Tax=Salinibacter sp. TaxID=2065818 RepID=UPI0035D496AD
MSDAPEPRLMISALEHYAYCPRQCALIHVEQSYQENVYTLRGNRDHDRVDEPETELRDDVRVERALPLYSEALGLTGRADVVEFDDGTPYPIEYKHGEQRRHEPGRIQLCAQALCLEEMMDGEVPAGALYHTGAHRRQEVVFTKELRTDTRDVIDAVRAQLRDQHVPSPVNDDRCPPCSLQTVCMPETVDTPERQRHETDRLFAAED